MFDAVIIGAGHNGLVCGAYLARAGYRVCVLEKRALIGGACVTEEVWPGYRVSTASYTMGLLQPKVILDLDLPKYGFQPLKTPPPYFPLQGGRHFVMWDEPERVQSEIARFSARDADAYPRYKEYLARLAPILRRLLFETPVDPGSGKFLDLLAAGRFVWRYRDAGPYLYDIYDLMTLSAYDLLSRWFESEDVKMIIGFFAGAGGGNSSIKSPGSAYMLVRGSVRDSSTPAGPIGLISGGMGAISQAIARSGQAHGMEIRTDAEVSRILVHRGKTDGVALVSGEEVRAKVVIANASARTTFTRLLKPQDLPATFLDRIKSLRCEATVFRINLALDGLPSVPGFPADLGFDYPVQLSIGSSLDYMEQAYDGVRYGQMAARPFLIVKTPSVVDPTLAPAGKHVMNIFGGHAPYSLRQGSWDERREELFAATMGVMRDYMPDLESRILHRQILSPLDLERIFDLPRGHPHHAEISADQIFFKRPAPHYADYRTPIQNLYQCGASTHPGGGVTGVPGHNAARVILGDRRRWA
jgi:phytoene dehydrogenase-like protein